MCALHFKANNKRETRIKLYYVHSSVVPRQTHSVNKKYGEFSKMKVEDSLHALVLQHKLLSRFNKCNLKVGYGNNSAGEGIHILNSNKYVCALNLNSNRCTEFN